MGQSINFQQSASATEFLDRDVDSHPPLHSPDINTLDNQYLRQVEGTEMDHPASFIETDQQMHERDIQPL